MKAIIFDEEIRLIDDCEKPVPKKGEALIKVTMVGICNTDYEISKGYMGYKGILGHEFVGVVEEITADDKSLTGKRVVGEINCGCKVCNFCKDGLERHCPERSTLGIWKREGCFSQYVCLPVSNLLEVPANVSDKEAVFTEPLAAAVEILEQIHILPTQKVLVLGDGKLGILIALTLNAHNLDVVLVGKHADKLKIAENQGVKTMLLDNLTEKEGKSFDIVVEATGSVSGFETSISLVKPRGVLVLKSTIATGKELNLAPIVIDEITVLGSRCGQFAPALRLLEHKKVDVTPLISKIVKMKDAVLGFELNKQKDIIKVLVEIDD